MDNKKKHHIDEPSVPIMAALPFVNTVSALGMGMEPAILPYFMMNDEDDSELME